MTRPTQPWITLTAISLLAVAAPAADDNTGEDLTPAVIVRIGTDDLNRVLHDSVLDAGGPVFSGHRADTTRGFSDIDYQARITPPELAFEENGGIRLSLTIEQAEIQVGHFEKKVLGRKMRCEDAAVEIHPGRPLELDVSFRVGLDDGDLALVATDFSLGDTRRSVQLIRPQRCRNKILPTRLMWWLGKPSLKRRIARLDDKLMKRATERAARIGDEGLLRTHWRIADGVAGGAPAEMVLIPTELTTSDDGLLVSWIHGDATTSPSPTVAPGWLVDHSDASFAAFSEPFVNELLQHRFAGVELRRRKPSGNFRRLVKSRRVLALIPGLRDVESRENVTFSVELAGRPVVRFDALTDSGDAVIRVELNDLLLHVHTDADPSSPPRGTLRIDRGVIAVAPYWSPAGGISFGLVENRWELSSDGMRFNEELLGTMLQELVFGEVFETRYNPLWLGGFDRAASLAPRAFRHVGDHLLVRLGDTPSRQNAPAQGAAADSASDSASSSGSASGSAVSQAKR